MTPARRAWYDLMLADEVRNAAYKRVLAMYAPGRTVVDVGAGLGHLSVWAMQAGARRVIMLESDPEAAEKAVRNVCRQLDSDPACPPRNVLAFSSSDSFGWDPEPWDLSDIVVAEVFDSSGVGEGAIETLRDARRFLRPGGVMIPDSMRVHVCLLYRPISEWGYGPAPECKLTSIDLSRLGPEAAAVYHASPWFDWCPGEEVGILVQRSGDVYGFGLAFTLQLAPGVSLSNLPSCPPTHWKQGALPFAGPVRAEKGQVWIVRGDVDHSRDRLNPDVSFNVLRIEGP